MTQLSSANPGVVTPGQAGHFDAIAGYGPFHVRKVGRVAVVTLESPSLREPLVSELAGRLMGLAHPDGPCLHRQAVSLGLVTDVTSSALHAFARVADGLNTLDGRLVLFAVPDPVRKIMHRTGLDRRVIIAKTVEDAIREAERRSAWSRLLRRSA